MSLEHLSPNDGSRRPKRRVCRGIGSGLGKTGGRGTKGQKARRQIRPWFEGGQTPIHRRLPVKKGFRNINHKEFAIVNLDDLQNLFESGATVNPDTLIATGIINDLQDGVKVLAFIKPDQKLDKKLNVSAHKVSEAARAAIEAAGGSVTIL